MRPGCRDSQRSYLGRPAATPQGKSICEGGLRRQESAEAIVSSPSRREGPNDKEDTTW
jgi:hypothetical protein